MSTPQDPLAIPTLRTEVPPPKTVTVNDIEFTLKCGKEYSFTLRPDLGDTITLDDQFLELKFGRTAHEVQVVRSEIALLARLTRPQVVELAHPSLGPFYQRPVTDPFKQS